MTDLSGLHRANADRWAHANLTRGPDFSLVAKRLIAPAAKAHYMAVAARTGVPWLVIAVIHERECSQSWTGSLAQVIPGTRSPCTCRRAAARSRAGKTRPSMPWSIA